MKSIRTKKKYAIIFIDIHDSQKINYSHGSEVYLKIINDFRRISEGIFDKMNPTVFGIQGDGAYAVFEINEFLHGLLYSFLVSLFFLFRWEKLDNGFEIGIGLHLGDAYEYKYDGFISSIEGENLIICSRLQKQTKKLREKLLLSQAFVLAFKKYPVNRYLTLKEYSLKDENLGEDEFLCSGMTNSTLEEIKLLIPILNNYLGSIQEYTIKPSATWSSIYKKLRNENDFDNPERKNIEGFIKIFSDFGFNLLPGFELSKRISFPFRVNKNDVTYSIFLLNTFEFPYTNHLFLNEFSKNKIDNIIYIVNEIGGLNSSNEKEYFPSVYPVKVIVLDISELSNIHALKCNIKEIEVELFKLIFLNKESIFNRSISETRKDLLQNTLHKRLPDFKEIESEFSNLRKILHKSDFSINEIAYEIKNNHPILSTEVLKYHNAALTPAYPTQDIERATIYIGANKIENFINIELAKKQIPDSFPGFGIVKDDYLQHCKSSGIFCEIMAKKLKFKIPYKFNGKNLIMDSYYSLGFLHDIGICFLDQFIQRYYRDIILEGGKKYFINQENEELHGIYHAHWSHTILGTSTLDDGTQTWALPKEVIDGIYYHHNPFDVPLQTNKLTRIVANLLFVSESLFENYYLKSEETFSMTQEYFKEALNQLEIGFEEVMEIFVETEEICDSL